MNIKQNCNIYCALTPFHYFLICQYFINDLKNDDKNILITNFSIQDIDARFKAVNCTHYAMPGKYGWELYIKNEYRKKLNYVVDNVAKIAGNCKEINLFAAVLINPISNGIYYCLKSNNGFSYINIPDGIASVTTTRRDYKDYIKLYIKLLLSRIGLIKYSSFGDRMDSQGIYCANVIYSFLPHLIKNKTKAIIKRIDLRGEMQIGEDILFLGQPDVEERIEEALHFLYNNYSVNNIYYKPHHRENIEFINKIEKNHNLKIISTNKCIEDFFVTEKSFRIVIACFSSALINLKMMFGDKVRCISYKGIDIIDECRKEELLALYNQFGVEIIGWKE